MKRFYFLLCLLLLLFSRSYGQTDRPELGINLEGYEYPYQANFFTLHSQNQTLQMAFMYEKADDWNGKTIMLLHGKNFNSAY